jgi:hypothetical protein
MYKEGCRVAALLAMTRAVVLVVPKEKRLPRRCARRNESPMMAASLNHDDVLQEPNRASCSAMARHSNGNCLLRPPGSPSLWTQRGHLSPPSRRSHHCGRNEAIFYHHPKDPALASAAKQSPATTHNPVLASAAKQSPATTRHPVFASAAKQSQLRINEEST